MVSIAGDGAGAVPAAKKPAKKAAAKKASSSARSSRTRASTSGGNIRIGVGGDYWTVNRQYAAAFTGFLKDLDRITGGYITSLGGVNNRNIAGTSTKSLHAYGLAIDVGNAGKGGSSRGDRALLALASPSQLRALANKWGLTWGGDWKNPDYMHFQVKGYQTKGQTLYYNGKVTNTISAPGSGGGGGGMANNTSLDERRLAIDFGYAAAFYNSDPSLKKLIARAEADQWTPEMFQARLMGTAWWKKHSAAERKWIQLTTSDPKEAKAQAQDRRVQIRQLSGQLGVTVGEKRIGQIAKDSLRFGWDGDRLRDAIAAEYDFNPKSGGSGVAGQTLSGLREMSRQYLVGLSDRTLERWTKRVLAGDAELGDFQGYMKKQATSLFPELSEEIAKGVTVDEYLDPYRELAAQTLEVNPEDVNWFEPKWSQAAFRNDADGKRKITSLADWGTLLRTDDRFGYDKTAGAGAQAAQLVGAFEKMFGASA